MSLMKWDQDNRLLLPNFIFIISQDIKIIFSGHNMDYTPTTFFILENEDLGWWWVGKTGMKLDTNGFPVHRSVSHDQLNEQLERKYKSHHEYVNAYLYIQILNKNECVCYGVERWLSKLEYEIKRKSDKYKNLKRLLTAGWKDDDYVTNSTINVLNIWNVPDALGRPKKMINIKELYEDLKKNWGTPDSSKPRSMHKLSVCLNEKVKTDLEYMNKRTRQIIIAKCKYSKKFPKPEIMLKYNISREELI